MDGKTVVSFAASTITFSEEEHKFATDVAVGIGFSRDERPIAEREPNRLLGIVSYAIPAKMHDFARRLLTLAESRIDDKTDLHFCYNYWIALLYPQRADPAMLDECKRYCEKDIKLWREIRKNKFFRDKETRVPAFQKLEMIFENAGEYEKAIKLCESVLADDRQSDHEAWQKRLERVQKKEKASARVEAKSNGKM